MGKVAVSGVLCKTAFFYTYFTANVFLSDAELLELEQDFPGKWEYYLDRLSCHIASTGKQYHSHAATIYKWAQEDAAKGKAAPKQGIPDYSCKEGESL